MANRSMTFRWVTEDVVVTFDYRDTLDDDDWDTFLGTLVQRIAVSSNVRILVYDVIGGPNAGQRARFGQRLRGKPVRVAVFCTSLFSHAITKAFHMMGFMQVVAFTPDQEESAFRHLNLTALEIERVRDAVAGQRQPSKSAAP